MALPNRHDNRLVTDQRTGIAGSPRSLTYSATRAEYATFPEEAKKLNAQLEAEYQERYETYKKMAESG